MKIFKKVIDGIVAFYYKHFVLSVIIVSLLNLVCLITGICYHSELVLPMISWGICLVCLMYLISGKTGWFTHSAKAWHETMFSYTRNKRYEKIYMTVSAILLIISLAMTTATIIRIVVYEIMTRV